MEAQPLPAITSCWVCPTCITARQQLKQRLLQQQEQLRATRDNLTVSSATNGANAAGSLKIEYRSGLPATTNGSAKSTSPKNGLNRNGSFQTKLSENGAEVFSQGNEDEGGRLLRVRVGHHTEIDSLRQAPMLVPPTTPIVAPNKSDPLDHLVQILRYHPQYLDTFLVTHRYLLYGNGPLPYDYRHYIGIMAAARNHCSYLVNAESSEFLRVGGDRTWLLGLKHIPHKLNNLSEISRLLAHRPWLLKPSHIAALTKGRGEDYWSLSELTHALVLLAHFHALASFVHGCGVSTVTDTGETGADGRPRSLSGGSNSEPSPIDGGAFNFHDGGSGAGGGGGGDVGIGALVEKMKQLSSAETSDLLEGMTPEEIAERFEKLEHLTIETASVKQQRTAKEDLRRFMDNAEFAYQEFSRQRNADGNGHKVQTFLIQDFSWEDQGYSLASRLYMEIGSLLDDKFTLAQQLTYFTCGTNTDVDTTPFRRAVWNFIHCIYGIRHDDYDYAEVSQLLDKNLRAYIKLVACFPDTVSRADYNSFMTELLQSEKVHINIMIMEARMQSELLYSLRAVSKHMA